MKTWPPANQEESPPMHPNLALPSLQNCKKATQSMITCYSRTKLRTKLTKTLSPEDTSGGSYVRDKRRGEFENNSKQKLVYVKVLRY